jgi:hypothetical protein
MDEALEALRDACGAADVQAWQRPLTLTALEALEAEIAPLRLPDQARQFWTLVNATTLRLVPYPAFITPEAALQAWRMGRDEFAAMQPLALVDVGYTSHGCMSVELHAGDIEGGALFEWFVSDPSGFDRRFNSLADWVWYVADLVHRGHYLRRDSERGPWVYVPDPAEGDKVRATRPRPGRHAVHGEVLHIGGDIFDWPEHWQRANGLRPEDMRPRGATHTVAEVLASPPDSELRATVAGRVVALGGSAGWTGARVDDGCGRLDIACPAAVTLQGPRMHDWFEFDIVVAPGERVPPPAPGGAEVTALAVRRIPAPR